MAGLWTHLDIWLLLAGLGIFLFGIRLIEDGIAKLMGRGFKGLVRDFTGTRAKAILTGTLATALLQSSSAVTLMVLAFVGAGVISLASGIGVVLGSNIGTTATSWIVATMGFKLEIQRLALPLIGIGGLMLIFLGRSPRYSQLSHLLVGFGFLFLGLDQMKNSVAGVAEGFDPGSLGGAPGWMFLLTGMTLTALMQSSSATTAILLTGLYAGLYDLHEGALAIVGSNIGTTVTVFLGAIGGQVVKKRLAWSHLSFNLAAAVVALTAMPFYLRAVDALLGERHDPVLGLALFHTLFNLFGVVVFTPLVPVVARSLERWVPERVVHRARYIAGTSPEVPEAAVTGVHNEVRQLLLEVLAYHLRLLDIDPRLVLPDGTTLMDQDAHTTHQDHYTNLKLLQAEIAAFVTQVERHELNEQESRALNRAVGAARLALYAAKDLKDVKGNLDAFADEEGFPQRFHGLLRKRVMATHLRIAQLLDDGAPDPMTAFAALLRQVEHDEAQGTRTVEDAAREERSARIDLSTALLVNRAVARASHDLALAVAELALPPADFHALERVQDVEALAGTGTGPGA